MDPRRTRSPVPQPPPRVVCVVGMHRSGSSLVARILHAHGFAVGEKLVGPSAFNTGGHFEDRRIVDINKKLLRHFGGSWDRPPELPDDWLREPLVRSLLERARAYRRERIDPKPRFLFKDPRTSLLIPFWREAFGAMLYVVVLREPRSVVQSVVRRNRNWLAPSRFWWRWARNASHLSRGAYEPLAPIDAARAERLWHLYYERILRDRAGEPTVPVVYERLVSRPEPAIRELLRQVCLEPPRVRSDAVEPALDHGSAGETSLLVRSYCERLRES